MSCEHKVLHVLRIQSDWIKSINRVSWSENLRANSSRITVCSRNAPLVSGKTGIELRGTFPVAVRLELHKQSFFVDIARLLLGLKVPKVPISMGHFYANISY